MNALDILDKLSNIIYEPVKLMTDWAREPLKTAEHKRQIDQEEKKIKLNSEIKIQEEDCLARIEADKKRLDIDLDIKRQTDVKKILAEIEEWRKDKELLRMKAVSDAIMQYQECLTQLHINAVSAIGNMQLDLKEKAENLVYEKTIKYKNLQANAHKQAFEEIMDIEREYAGNEVAKSILYKSVEMRLVNMITTAKNFLIELNNDIIVLNESINLITERGQVFIKEHLEHFHMIQNISDSSLLGTSDPNKET